jgi:hypothetical protein
MINTELVTSRNQEQKYKYFLVRTHSDQVLGETPLEKYTMCIFINPVTKSRGVSILSNSYTKEVTPIEEHLFDIGSVPHPKYTNQNREPLNFYYRDIPQKIISVEASRTENINLYGVS